MATGRADGPGAAQAASQGAPSLAHALQSAQKLLGNESPGGAGPEKRGLAALLARRLLDAGFVDEESYLSISGQHAVRGRFAFACLAVLEVVHRALVSDATAHLGVRDLRTVRGLLEVVVAWGLLPHFLPAVGVSLARRVRSGNSAVMAGQPLFDPLRDESARLCDLDASISSGRLYQVLSVIMGWVSSAASRRGLSDIVCTKYLADLFAGLAQLSYGPPTCSLCDEPGKVDRDLEPGVADAGTDNLPVKLFRIMGAAHYPDVGPAERDQAKNWLKTLFALSDPFRSMDALVTLMSAASTPPKPTQSNSLGESWMKSFCGTFLSQIALRPGGVRVILDYMVDEQEAVGADLSLNQLECITRLLLSVPKQAKTAEGYFAGVSAQLLEVICAPQETLTGTSGSPARAKANVLRAATFVISRFILRRPRTARKLIVRKIVGPFWDWWGPMRAENSGFLRRAEPSDGEVHMTEAALEEALLCVSRLLMTTDRAPELMSMVLRIAAPALWSLRVFAGRTRSLVGQTAEDILASYFSITPNEETCEVLWKAAGLKKRMEWRCPRSGDWMLEFAKGPTGGCQLVWRSVRHKNAELTTGADVLTDNAREFVELMKTVTRDRTVCGDFFARLLVEHAQASSWQRSNEICPTALTITDSTRMVTILSIAAAMIQSLGPAILKRPTQMLSVAVSILESWKDPEERMLEARTERLNARNSATGDFGGAPRMFADIVSGLDEQEEEEMMRVVEEENRLQEDTLLLAMSMTAAIVAEHKDLTSQDLGLLQAALPLLARFADNPSSVLRESAAEVRGAVLTRTVAGLSLKSTGSDAVQQGLERFRSACSMIEESLLPVRAHGLALLRELVLERNPVIDEHLEIGSGSDDAGRKSHILCPVVEVPRKVKVVDRILEIFVNAIQDEDSFIYLNATRCLSALTDTQGERIIQKLGELYRGTGVLGKQLDARLRIGEALLQTVRRCGTALGKYVRSLVSPLFAVLLEEKQRHLRASALSILAVACETCPHSLGRLHHDIVNYVCDLLLLENGEGEEGQSVRRAATVVLVFLIRGLGPDVLGAFPKDLIRRAAVALRNVEALDADELARHQARIGLEELEIAVLEALVPFEA